MTRLATFCIGVTATFGLLVACSNETITIATVLPDTESSSEAGVRIQVGSKCTQNSDCPDPNMYCEHDSCDSVAGTCHFPPPSCPNIEDPKCGCDGFTYFNDCLRKLAGVSAADDGECNHHAVTCDSNGVGCGNSGALCARLGFFGTPTACGPTTGRCWILPSTCPAPDNDNDMDGLRWDECSADAGAAHCSDTCTAIHTGKAFVRAQEQCQ